MPRVKLKGINPIHRKLADGSVRTYYYHRATGTRLLGEPGSPEFLAAYAQAEKAIKSTDRNKGTFKELIQRYIGSPDYGKLAKATKVDYRRHIRAMEGAWGDMTFGVLEDRRVRTVFMDKADELAVQSARQSDYFMQVLGIILQWSVDRGFIERNNARRPKKRYRANRADKIWLPEHVESMMRTAPAEIQMALMLALHTGQRQADLLAVTWNNWDGHTLTFIQRKTGVKVEVPATDALKKMLDTAPRKALTILTTETGRSWGKDYFRQRWRKASLTAGIDGLHFHDLRGTAISMLAASGCSNAQIAAISGHKLASVHRILDTYLSRTRHLAEAAILKFEESETTDFAKRMTINCKTQPKGAGKQ